MYISSRETDRNWCFLLNVNAEVYVFQIPQGFLERDLQTETQISRMCMLFSTLVLGV